MDTLENKINKLEAQYKALRKDYRNLLNDLHLLRIQIIELNDTLQEVLGKLSREKAWSK